MDVTIAICTHSRRGELLRTLEGLRALVSPGGPRFEVVVIDNASTDGTTAALAGWRLDGVPTRVVPEPVAGLCQARNRAIESANGNYLLFLDDDVTVTAALLTAYQDAFSRFPEAPFLGGPIVPVFDPPVTELALAIAERQPGVYSALDVGPEMQPLIPTDGPWGANCCIRMASIGSERFDSRFGYLGRDIISGDEVEFLSRLFKHHGPGVWVPDARVEHRIPTSRASWDYLRRSAYGSGRARVRLAALHGRRKWTLPQMLLTAHTRYWKLRRQHRALGEHAPLGDRVTMEYDLWRAHGTADEARDMMLRRSPIQRAAEAAT